MKRLVEDRHVAASQDALVERAITELARQIRDADDARLWEHAAADADFRAEAKSLDAGFAKDDLSAWEL